MFWASFRRSPVTPLLLTRSEPAAHTPGVRSQVDGRSGGACQQQAHGMVAQRSSGRHRHHGRHSPARSTRWSFPAMIWPVSLCTPRMKTDSMQWDREECSFMLVAYVARVL